jgi:hypothetical protein
MQNPKAEIRSPKEGRNPKAEKPKPGRAVNLHGTPHAKGEAYFPRD